MSLTFILNNNIEAAHQPQLVVTKVQIKTDEEIETDKTKWSNYHIKIVHCS